MANINVSFADVNAAADRLASGKEDIHAQLAALQAQINNLVSSGFITDRTSVAFQSSYGTFTKGARDTISGLNGLSTFLRRTAATLQDVDQQLASALPH